jgi:hypothetical protein
MDRTPFNPVMGANGRKLIYCTRNAKLVPVALLYPNKLDDTSFMLDLVMKAENYVHDGWFEGTTSLVFNTEVNVDGSFDVETRNSIYKVVDDSLKAADVIHARIEALFEATYIKGSHVHMPAHSALVELFEAHATYDYFKTDEPLVTMLRDIKEESDLTSDWQIRLLYRQPLRRFLTLCVENGVETQCNLSFERT